MLGMTYKKSLVGLTAQKAATGNFIPPEEHHSDASPLDRLNRATCALM